MHELGGLKKNSQTQEAKGLAEITSSPIVINLHPKIQN